VEERHVAGENGMWRANMTSRIRRKAAAAAALAAICACALAGTMVAGALAAEEFVSSYTSTAANLCKKVQGSKGADEGDWGVRSCPGLAGFIVRMTEDDLRMTVSFGRSMAAAKKEPAARQGFGPFNLVNDRLEWRSVKGAPQPFAIIQRWLIADNESPDKNGRPLSVGLLVVTRLAPGSVCHAAYIDVRANPNAIAIARQAADEKARTFDCAGKPEVAGERGRAIELALP
jgi:hypothetical protein